MCPHAEHESMGGTVAVVQARMTSSRLPGKVMLPLAGLPVIDRVVNRVRRCRQVDEVWVAVPTGDSQKRLVAHLQHRGVPVTQGSESDVLARTMTAALASRATVVVRVTSDCPFVEPAVVDAVVAARRAGGVEYARTAMDRGFPLGFDCEAMTVPCLEAACREAVDPYEREHVTPFIWRRPERFSTMVLDHAPDRRHWRLVIDSERDYAMAATLYEALGSLVETFGYDDLRQLLAARPDILEMNCHEPQTPYRR